MTESEKREFSTTALAVEQCRAACQMTDEQRRTAVDVTGFASEYARDMVRRSGTCVFAIILCHRSRLN